MPIQENQNNAGYLIRLFASLLNGFIWWTVFLLLPLYLLSVNYLENKEAVIANMVFYALLFLFLISVGIYYVHIYMTSKYGGSPGKLLFGLKVLDNDTSEYLGFKTALLRFAAGYAFSSQFFGIGYYMIIRSKDNRAWHDELFNTRVARVGSPLFGIIATITLFILFVFLISLIIGNFS